MSKKYKNTKGSNEGMIKYAIKERENAKIRFDGTIYEYCRWRASSWNEDNPDNLITEEGVGMTEEIKKELNELHFNYKGYLNGTRNKWNRIYAG